jgi:molybdopterin-containing oxidoreductase family membrane subunit
MMLVYIVFKIIDTFVWATHLLPRAGLTFEQMFHGWVYGKWLMWLELLCALLPAVLLIVPALRRIPSVFYSMLILSCVSVTLNRYLMTVQALAIPVMPFDSWQTYLPNWAEWGACALVVAYSGIVLSLAYRYLPIFPQEKGLNEGRGALSPERGQ